MRMVYDVMDGKESQGKSKERLCQCTVFKGRMLQGNEECISFVEVNSQPSHSLPWLPHQEKKGHNNNLAKLCICLSLMVLFTAH